MREEEIEREREEGMERERERERARERERESFESKIGKSVYPSLLPRTQEQKRK